jgi:hypothetical protein
MFDGFGAGLVASGFGFTSGFFTSGFGFVLAPLEGRGLVVGRGVAATGFAESVGAAAAALTAAEGGSAGTTSGTGCALPGGAVAGAAGWSAATLAVDSGSGFAAGAASTFTATIAPIPRSRRAPTKPATSGARLEVGTPSTGVWVNAPPVSAAGLGPLCG